MMRQAKRDGTKGNGRHVPGESGPAPVRLSDRRVGPGEPVYVVAEIGINHNGDPELAHELIDAAHRAGCDAVKFQKRTPEACVPPHMRERTRETPWGTLSYPEYRRRVELGEEAYREIHARCRELGLDWFASCWDEPSVDFIGRFDPPCFKVHSAAVTDRRLLERLRATGRPLVLSTGMSTAREIDAAVELLEPAELLILHCTSTYPCPPEEINLSAIETLRRQYSHPVGYSGHEEGLAPSVAAVALGACYVERHLTLDREMWGSDHEASLEPGELRRLVEKIRTLERAMGDGEKRVYPGERAARRRLRREAEAGASSGPELEAEATAEPDSEARPDAERESRRNSGPTSEPVTESTAAGEAT